MNYTEQSQEYRLNLMLRRRGDAALDQNHAEFRSEDYDNDEEFWLAVASHGLELMKEDREFLLDQGGDDDNNS